jgi:hypothetical protein
MKLVGDMSDLEASDWQDYRSTIIVPNREPNRSFGAYAVAARRRKVMCPAAAEK